MFGIMEKIDMEIGDAISRRAEDERTQLLNHASIAHTPTQVCLPLNGLRAPQKYPRARRASDAACRSSSRPLKLSMSKVLKFNFSALSPSKLICVDTRPDTTSGALEPSS